MAIRKLKKKEDDEYFTILISKDNLRKEEKSEEMGN